MPAINRSITLITALSVALATFFLVAHPATAQRAKHPAPWVGKRIDGKDCKGTQVGFGPYDYLDRYNNLGWLAVVENAHFNEDVEALRAPMTAPEPMGDIHYTLQTWPNHHRALKSTVDYRLQHRKWSEKSKGLPAECYLYRAINYSPNDGMPYYLLGFLLHNFKKYKEALEAYQTAEKFFPNDMLIKYNIGLTMVQLKQYAEARKVAEIVYKNGFPLPGLRNQLQAAGQWKKAAKPGKKKEFTEEERMAYLKILQEKSQQASEAGADDGPDAAP